MYEKKGTKAKEPLQDFPEVFCQLVDRTKNVISLASIENSLDLCLLVMQT